MALTKRQERFVQELIKGKSQRQAMLVAYPQRKKWKDTALDSTASTLFRKPWVNKRYQDLLMKVRENETNKVMWTREEAIRSLKYVVEVNTQDLDRIQDAMNQELELLQKQIEQEPEKAAQLVQQMIRNRKSRRANAVNNKGITEAVAELNKMQGYNEENISMTGAVVFTGEELLED